MNIADRQSEAVRILAAHWSRETLSPITDRAAVTLEDAYAIQGLLTQARLNRGERLIGWKLGYTSLAMRQQMRVDSPNFGPLTDAMVLVSGAAVPATMTQPRVEPEIALCFAHDVLFGADRAAVVRCLGSAHASLEIVDSVWGDYRFTLEDNTADGSSAAGVVVGPALPQDAIERAEVAMWVDGEAAGCGVGSDAGGHPADGVAWLVQQLTTLGYRLRAGDLVLTGGITRAAPLRSASIITALFNPGEIELSIRRD